MLRIYYRIALQVFFSLFLCGTSIAETRADVTLADSLNALSKKMTFSNPDSARKMGLEAAAVSMATNDFPNLTKAYNNIGITYAIRSDYDSAQYYFLLNDSVIDQHQDLISALSLPYNNMGNIYIIKGNYPEAMNACIKYLKACEIIKDSLGIASAYSSLGVAYQYQDNFLELYNFTKKALEINLLLKNELGLAANYRNLAEAEEALEKYDSALVHHNRSLELKLKLNHLHGIGDSYASIGSLYKRNKEYQPALEAYKKGLYYLEKAGNKLSQSSLLENIAELYLDQNNSGKALYYGNQGLVLAKEANSPDQIRKAHRMLYLIYKARNDPGEALRNYEEFAKISDTLAKKENREILADVREKYESEKKEHEITLLNKDLELDALEINKQKLEIDHQKTQRNSLIAILGLLCALLVLAYWGIRKIKAQKVIVEEQNEELNAQNEEILSQRDQIEKQKEIVEEQKKEIVDSINYAESIQRAILANKDTWSQIGSDNFILFRPRDIVSGDFYWAYADDERLIWVAADCTGHGVPGAFMSMLGISFLHQIVFENQHFEPGEILNQLRQKITGSLEQKHVELQQKDGMDMTLCTFEKKTGILKYAGAHNPLYIFRKGLPEMEVIKADKMPVGKFDYAEGGFTQHEFRMQPGDFCYTFSDGFIDQFGGEKDKKYGSKKFKELLTGMGMSDLSCKEQHDALNEEITAWIGKGEQLDDICIVGVRI